MCGRCRNCDSHAVVCVISEYAERVRECVGNGNVGGVGGCVVAVSAGHEYMEDTRGPGIVSSADEVLKMSVVRGMRGVGGVCMCLGRSGVGGEGESR